MERPVAMLDTHREANGRGPCGGEMLAQRTTVGPFAKARRNLVLATWTFVINFWAWNLIAPLASRHAEQLSLSSAQASLLVATPVLVGSYPLLLVFGFFLGIAGTTFAVGIPFVNAWYEPGRRGFATGVFGAGMGGTALSAFFTPRFVGWFGYVPTHVMIAAALVVVAVFGWFGMRDAPGWRPNTSPVIPKLRAALKLPVTWQMSFLYAVTFGGFVAFSTYLPTYLKDVYEFDLTGAGTRTAGFAIAAVIARPIGGILSDRMGPPKVDAVSLIGPAVPARRF